MKPTTKPRGAPWYEGMFVHRDVEIEFSEHDACGGRVRSQHMSSLPPVVTDETAFASAIGYADVDYCPKCNVAVEIKCHIFSERTGS